MKWTRVALASLSAVVLLAAGAYIWLSRPLPATDSNPKDPPVAPTSANLFRDVTTQAGLEFSYRNGQEADNYAILESIGGGVSLIDFDGDGLLDVFLTGGGYFDGLEKKSILGHPCRLYRNLGGWKFRDVTVEVGLDKIDFYSHGSAVADYDCDGWPDLLVTGYGRLALFHNEPDGKGGRRFVDSTKEAGLRREHFWSTSAAWGDLDGDGYPDLYVCQYVDWSFANHPACEGYTPETPRDICSPRQFEARPHALYRNGGKGKFTDVSNVAGLRMPRTPADYARLSHLNEDAKNRLQRAERERDFGKGLGVVMVDADGDRRPEIYVANDTTDKFLYANRSSPGQIRLEEVGTLAGVAVDDRGLPNGSMGVDAGDYDGSGRPALLVTNYENELHALYRNSSRKDNLLFEYSTHRVGMASLGRLYVGFGTAFFDLDSDGWQDVVIAHGHVIRHPTRAGVRQRPVLLQNRGLTSTSGIRFENIADRGGSYFRSDHQGRGLAVGDLDNDGRPDLIISHVNEPVVLLRNEASAGGHWLGIELFDPEHRDLVGAKLVLEADGRRLTRFATAGGSYLSSGDRRHLFGLGKAAQAGRLTVTWPTGQEQHWVGLGIDRYWRLVRGGKEAEYKARPQSRE